MSLSRRLVLILLALSAAGLAALSLVSYLALRSYLSERLDDQARQSLPLVGRLLIGGRAGGAPGELPRGPDGPAGPQLPGGTYGEIRDPAGEVTASGILTGAERESPRPRLPAAIEVAPAGGEPEPFDVPAVGSGSGFRVVVQPLPGGSTLLAALPLAELDRTLGRLRRIELIVSLAILAALALASVLAVRAGLRPLARMELTAREIAAGDMSHRVADADERTEVGRLGTAFNEMLARLERAFAEQQAAEERLRRFLADASHELRTPLSSIRGYAELFRLGAAAEPEELRRAINRIESESVRMSGLVDDLLTLARLDEVREQRREPVDLAEIAADACADARAGAGERPVELRAAPGAVVEGDADQLRQLLGNLVRNALVHGREGPVEVSVEPGDGEVALRVRDHGPGLPPGEERRVFGRFLRAGEARDRASGGAGLGLAIVDAIATAHRGSAEAANADGGGAVFTVRLPSSRAAAPRSDSAQRPLS